MAPLTHLSPTWSGDDVGRCGLPRFNSDQTLQIREELSLGAGFAVVSGVPAETNPGSFVAFGERLGFVLPQNRRQETLVEIADFSDEDEFDDRGYRSPGELTPHTDPPPLIALHCVRAAKSGGTSMIVNAVRVHREIERSDTEACRILERGFRYLLPDKARRHLLLRLWLDADWLPNPPPTHAFRRDIVGRMTR